MNGVQEVEVEQGITTSFVNFIYICDTYQLLLLLDAWSLEMLVVVQLGGFILSESLETIIIPQFMRGSQSIGPNRSQGAIKLDS